MLRVAFEYLDLSLIALFLGANNIGGLSFSTGRALGMGFMALMVLSFAARLMVFQDPHWLP